MDLDVGAQGAGEVVDGEEARGVGDAGVLCAVDGFEERHVAGG